MDFLLEVDAKRAIDVDTPFDLAIAEAMLKKKI